MCFPMNLSKFLGAPFLQKTSGRLFLRQSIMDGRVMETWPWRFEVWIKKLNHVLETRWLPVWAFEGITPKERIYLYGCYFVCFCFLVTALLWCCSMYYTELWHSQISYSPSYNLAPPISRVLIGQYFIFCSLTSPTCCNSPQKCTPVQYKKRQKAAFPIVT